MLMPAGYGDGGKGEAEVGRWGGGGGESGCHKMPKKKKKKKDLKRLILLIIKYFVRNDWKSKLKDGRAASHER